MKHYPSIFELRQVIDPIPAFAEFYKQFSSTVQEPPRELMIYLIMQYLKMEGFTSTLSMFEQESQVFFSGKSKPDSEEDESLLGRFRLETDSMIGRYRNTHSWNMGQGGDFFTSGPFGSFYPQDASGLGSRPLGIPTMLGAGIGEPLAGSDREGAESQKPLLSIIVSAAMGQAEKIQTLTKPNGEIDIEKVKDQLVRSGLITCKSCLSFVFLPSSFTPFPSLCIVSSSSFV